MYKLCWVLQWRHREVTTCEMTVCSKRKHCFSFVMCNSTVNTLRPRQNGNYFPSDILKCISFNENICISFKISLEFVPRGPINNIRSLVQLMAWRRSGRWISSQWICDAESVVLSWLSWVNIARLKLHTFYGLIAKLYVRIIMTSSNGSIFRVTGPLWGEFTGLRWIPLTKACDAELWCFLWSAPEQTVEQTIERLVILHAIAPIMTSLQW